MYHSYGKRRLLATSIASDRETERRSSERDTWWQFYLRDTPDPGSYEIADFIEEEEKKPATYSFKSVGRNRSLLPSKGKGDLLLPGAYRHDDMCERLKTDRSTYGFRNTPRNVDAQNIGTDKATDMGPGHYETQIYDSIGTQNTMTKSWFFKSNVQRFPTIYFQPKEGVSPGSYQTKNRSSAQTMRGTSCFISKTPRFRPSNTKIPGPGYYEKTVQYPMPRSVSQMARVHGIFFPGDFHL